MTSFDKDHIRFLLLEGVHPCAVEHLNLAGYHQVEYHKTALSEEVLKEKIQNVQFVGIRSRTQLTDAVLAQAKQLYAVGCFCIGTNQVDCQAAAKRGIVVFNAPYSNTRSVAEMVLGEMILLLRGVPEKNAKAHRGVWLKSAHKAYESRGKTLGIIGYGNIGSQLSILAENLGMNVLFYDTVTKLPLGNAQSSPSLAYLLANSDVISVHVPDNASTQNMINAGVLAQMKPGAIFINASRGSVVQIDALADALENEHLSGAAIDVFPSEPKANDERFISRLQGIDNVILTPHIGGSTVEAQKNIGLEVADKLVRYSDTGASLSAVNFPEVALPPHPDLHRILHIHHNVPGVLSEINQIFSAHQINICGQYLQTQGETGYVVTDINVDTDRNPRVLAALKQVSGTLRCRILY